MATTKTIAARTTNVGSIAAFLREIEKKINQIAKKTLNHPCIRKPPFIFYFII